MKGLDVGEAIYTLLTNKGVKRVYPLVADQGTQFPFVVYRRTGLQPSDTKDRYNFLEEATVDIMIVSDKYSEGTDLAKKINEIEGYFGEVAGISIRDIELINATEDYLDNSFVQKMTLRIEIQ